MDHRSITVQEEPPREVFSAGGIVFKNPSLPALIVLLVRHRGAKHWGFPKGHIGDRILHESPEDAAVREVREEGGVVARIAHPDPIITKYTVNAAGGTVPKTVSYYIMTYVSGDPNDHDHEIEEAGFFDIEEAYKKLTYDIDKKALQQALQTMKV